MLAAQGYCVVAIDSRGSQHRGLQFESHLRRKMVSIMLNCNEKQFKMIVNRPNAVILPYIFNILTYNLSYKLKE